MTLAIIGDYTSSLLPGCSSSSICYGMCLQLDYFLQGLHFPLLIENQMTSLGACLETSVDQDFDGRYYLIIYSGCGYTLMCAHITEDLMDFSPSPLPPRYSNEGFEGKKSLA